MSDENNNVGRRRNCNLKVAKRIGDSLAENMNSVPQPKRRNRYTSNACNECKRRKVRCSGDDNVCQRCATNGFECIYSSTRVFKGPQTPSNDTVENKTAEATMGHELKADHEELAEMKANISMLQRQVEYLMSNREASISTTSPHSMTMTSHVPSRMSGRLAAVPAQVNPPGFSSSESEGSNSPAYTGITSSKFGFDIAKATLDAGAPKFGDRSTIAKSFSSHRPAGSESGYTYATSSSKIVHPLFLLQKVEALRLIETYQEWIGIVYPCLDVESVRRYTIKLFDEGPTGHNNSYLMHGSFEEDSRFDRDLEILKTVLACAMVVKGLRHSNVAEQLIESVQNTFYQRMKIIDVDMKELLILLLMSCYHFHNNQEVMAWRVLGIAARGCFEMGLHRRSAWDRSGGIFPGDLERSWAMRVFWCIYVLDRRYSFGTGLPFAIEEAEVDTELPKPEESTPYLTCMIAYGRLGSKIWKAVSEDRHLDHYQKLKHNSDLDVQILHWYQNLTPKELRFSSSELSNPEENARIYILRVLLYPRANQMRILIYRKCLFSSASIANYHGDAQLVTDVAKDTISVLQKLNQTSDHYRDQPMMFNYFLLSALAVLFLAVCHAPSWFGSSSRPFFDITLNLIKGFPAKSLTSKRLSKTIKDLKSLIPKLGPPSSRATPGIDGTRATASQSEFARMEQGDQPQPEGIALSSAIPNSQPYSQDLYIESDFQMTNDLTDLFEAVGGMDYLGATEELSSTSYGHVELPTGPQANENDTQAGLEFMDNEQLYNLMTNLF